MLILASSYCDGGGVLKQPLTLQSSGEHRQLSCKMMALGKDPVDIFPYKDISLRLLFLLFAMSRETQLGNSPEACVLYIYIYSLRVARYRYAVPR